MASEENQNNEGRKGRETIKLVTVLSHNLGP